MFMPRKKIFYVPGLISLLALPVMLLTFSPENPVSKSGLKLYLPRDDSHSPPREDINYFSEYYVLQTVKNKKITSVFLDDLDAFANDKPDFYNAKLNFVSKEFERMNFNRDTNDVLKVILDETCDYAAFVWLNNQAIIHDIKRYALVDDSFYFLSNEPPVHYTGGTLEIENIFLSNEEYSPPTNWELFWGRIGYSWEEWKYYIQRNYWLCIGFLILILFPWIIGFRKIRRNFPLIG